MNQPDHRFALAGLLHDIGKFGQRADLPMDQSALLSEQTRRMAGQLCHWSQRGFFSHQHVLWTSQFLEDHRALFAGAGLLDTTEDNLFNLAAFHHRPATLQQAIITLADHWSSGIDRNTDRILERDHLAGKDKFRSVPLLSLFHSIATPARPGGQEGPAYGYSLQANGISEGMFPVPYKELDLREQYAELWKAFNEEVARIQATSPDALLCTLYHLLRKYTWYIPASTMDYPDCSLFEHMKTTGALAHALAGYLQEHPEAAAYTPGGRIDLQDGHFPVLMVCGDLSGIQSFIYNISNKRAMKGLKGRSFYVQLLAETVCDEILQACGAGLCSTVYAAGGKFYLLLPNTAGTREALNRYRREIRQRLWDEYGGKISVQIGEQAFAMARDKEGLRVRIPEQEDLAEVGELWKRLADKTAQSKRTRLNEIIRSRYDALFTPSGTGGDVAICAVTGEEIARGGAAVLKEEEGEEGEALVSEQVQKQISIGRQLYEARYLLKHRGPTEDSFSAGTGTHWSLGTSTRSHSVEQWLNIRFDGTPELFPDRTPEKNTGHGFKFYGGLPMASDGKRPYTLEELCASGSGTEKLGILRMDVDNLGSLFQRGFAQHNASFSKLATLSALLDQFFGGYLSVLRNKDRYRDHINIVYAGGDDLFALGRWDLLAEFATELRKAFRRFVCGRSNLSISGGMVIVGPRFPVAKAAEMAQEAESRAKAFGPNLKNAFDLFGITVSWEEEMDFITECKNDLVQWCSSFLSKGFLMKMFDFYTQYKKGRPDWQWQSAYSIARYADKDRGEHRQVFETIRNLLFARNYKNRFLGVRFEAFIVACRWAELELKNTKNN